MRIGFTGTRKGMTDRQMDALKLLLEDIHYVNEEPFHHGGAKGADIEASTEAESWGYRCVAHLASPKTSENLLRRNRDIVDSSDILIAAPSTLTERVRGSGTWYTMRYARRIGIPVVILDPGKGATEAMVPHGKA